VTADTGRRGLKPTVASWAYVEVVATVSVRYIVYDVDAAIDFYCRNLGFSEVMHPAPTFAMLARGDLRLVLSSSSRPDPRPGCRGL